MHTWNGAPRKKATLNLASNSQVLAKGGKKAIYRIRIELLYEKMSGDDVCCVSKIQMYVWS